MTRTSALEKLPTLAGSAHRHAGGSERVGMCMCMCMCMHMYRANRSMISRDRSHAGGTEDDTHAGRTTKYRGRGGGIDSVRGRCVGTYSAPSWTATPTRNPDGGVLWPVQPAAKPTTLPSRPSAELGLLAWASALRNEKKRDIKNKQFYNKVGEKRVLCVYYFPGLPILTFLLTRCQRMLCSCDYWSRARAPSTDHDSFLSWPWPKRCCACVWLANAENVAARQAEAPSPGTGRCDAQKPAASPCGTSR